MDAKVDQPTDPLEQPCPACERPSGDHTLREWQACMEVPGLDLEFQEIEDTQTRQAASAALADQLGFDSSALVADHVVTKAVVIGAGPVRVGGLVMEFQIGNPTGIPDKVGTVVFLGRPDLMRSFGRLVRDSANGAANRTEEASGGA